MNYDQYRMLIARYNDMLSSTDNDHEYTIPICLDVFNFKFDNENFTRDN